MIDMPFFMEDDRWYFYDYEKKKYVLTKEAPEEARQSLKEFYKELKED